jgi:ABC-type sugar transport system substrate-binding protein
MKKFMRTVGIVLAAAFLLAPAQVFANGGKDAAGGGKGTITVGLALTGMQNNPIFIDIRRAFEERCNQAGYRLIAADLSNGAADMTKFLENCLTAKAKIVVFQNIAEDSYINLLTELKAQGAILASYDNPSKVADYVSMASNYDLGKTIGRMCGEWVSANTGSKKAALATFNVLDFMIVRADGIKAGFKEACPEGNIVFEQDINIADGGVALGEAIITAHPDIQGIMAITDIGCIGIGQAFAAAGWTSQNHRIGMFGSDASEDGMREIRKNGMFIGTVYMDLVNQVTGLFDRSLETAQTGKINEAEKLVYFPMQPITIENADLVGKPLPKK